MRYAQIRELDISNGEGVGIALFVQGCHFCCENCFNSKTWDFNGGKAWTREIEDDFIKLAARLYIKRVSILGGEPLARENLDGVLNLVQEVRLLIPQKNIWLYTGFYWNEVFAPSVISDPKKEINNDYKNEKRKKIITQCDVLVDGRYMDSQRDPTLRWRGSKNQSVIDIQKTLKSNDNEIVLWES